MPRLQISALDSCLMNFNSFLEIPVCSECKYRNQIHTFPVFSYFNSMSLQGYINLKDKAKSSVICRRSLLAQEYSPRLVPICSFCRVQYLLGPNQTLWEIYDRHQSMPGPHIPRVISSEDKMSLLLAFLYFFQTE